MCKSELGTDVNIDKTVAQRNHIYNLKCGHT